MPDSTLPKWARAIGRTLRAAAYSAVVIVGIGDLNAPSPLITHAAGPSVVHIWAIVCLSAGAVGAAATLLHRWRWEMIAASLVATALAARAAAVWLTVDEGSRLGAAASISVAALLFLLRVLDLMLFAAKASAGIRRRRRRHRGAAA